MSFGACASLVTRWPWQKKNGQTFCGPRNSINREKPSERQVLNMAMAEMTKQGLLDSSAAREAVEMALPSIEKALQRPGVSGEQCLHLVIVDPLAKYGATSFPAAILYEFSIGDPKQWGADYRSFARGKAELAWKSNCDTHMIQEVHPHMLRIGDTLLWGGVCRDGLIVAASGAHPWFDEAFANMVAGFLLAVAQERARAAREKGAFLEEQPKQPITRKDREVGERY